MSELLELRKKHYGTRQWLLSSVCILAVSTSPIAITAATADDTSDHPTVWIELGGQLERLDSRQDAFAPPFTVLQPGPGPYEPISPLTAQRAPTSSYGAEGRLSFQPAGSEWTLSAVVRYGRSNNNKHIHQQSAAATPNRGNLFRSKAYITYQVFFDARVKNKENHLVADFTAGRDVGIGIIGSHGTSALDFGLRSAEFDTKSDVSLIARPSVQFVPVVVGPFHVTKAVHNDYVASAVDTRSFHGLGPSLSWKASASLTGDADRRRISVDWGINAAVLFGRQKAQGAHQVDARYYNGKYQTVPPYGADPIYFHATPHDRLRTVIVPNVGGFLGASFRYPNAKVSFGYRADFFFGAMDTGIDTRHTADRSFYGPFATISIGLGG